MSERYRKKSDGGRERDRERSKVKRKTEGSRENDIYIERRVELDREMKRKGKYNIIII